MNRLRRFFTFHLSSPTGGLKGASSFIILSSFLILAACSGGCYVGAGAGTFVGVIIGAPIGVIFLGECGAATGSAVGGGIGSTIGTIIGYYTGKNIGIAIYDLFQEYLDIITH